MPRRRRRTRPVRNRAPRPALRRRSTPSAPAALYAQRNPLAVNELDHPRARQIFATNDGAGCIACHGRQGNGRGPLAARLAVPPRDFTCRATMDTIPDGQLFWVIRHGSPGTAMLGHGELSDEETWQLVAYIRTLGGAPAILP